MVYSGQNVSLDVLPVDNDGIELKKQASLLITKAGDSFLGLL